MSKQIPTGRLRRTAKVGGLVGGEAVRGYATKAANVARSTDARQAAEERRQIEEAERVVDVLGHMKGVAMKVGQIASVIDLEGLPPDARDRFQAIAHGVLTRCPSDHRFAFLSVLRNRCRVELRLIGSDNNLNSVDLCM